MQDQEAADRLRAATRQSGNTGRTGDHAPPTVDACQGQQGRTNADLQHTTSSAS